LEHNKMRQKGSDLFLQHVELRVTAV